MVDVSSHVLAHVETDTKSTPKTVTMKWLWLGGWVAAAIATVREMINPLSPKPLRCPERFNDPVNACMCISILSQRPVPLHLIQLMFQ